MRSSDLAMTWQKHCLPLPSLCATIRVLSLLRPRPPRPEGKRLQLAAALFSKSQGLLRPLRSVGFASESAHKTRVSVGVVCGPLELRSGAGAVAEVAVAFALLRRQTLMDAARSGVRRRRLSSLCCSHLRQGRGGPASTQHSAE